MVNSISCEWNDGCIILNIHARLLLFVIQVYSLVNVAILLHCLDDQIQGFILLEEVMDEAQGASP